MENKKESATKKESTTKKELTIQERIEALPPEIKEICKKIFNADNDLSVIASLLNSIVGIVRHLKTDYSAAIERENNVSLIAAGGWPAIQKVDVIIEGAISSFNKAFATYNSERIVYLNKVEATGEENGSK